MYSKGYPVAKFTYNDMSGAQSNLFSPTTDGLCVPFFFILAERGVPGKIYYGGGKEMTQAFGQETFRTTSPFYNPATHFLNTAMAGQGVNVMRLVDPSAQTSDLGLFVTMTTAAITQYQVDSAGRRLVDSAGDYIPITGSGGAPVTEPGYVATWSVRALGEETFDNLAIVSSGGGSVTFPVLGFRMKWPGSGGNRMGFRLFSPGINDSTLFSAIGSTLYRFVPIELPTAVSTTASTITSLYGSDYVDISFKDSAVYDRTAVNYSFDNTLAVQYTDQSTGESILPYDIHSYSENVKTVGDMLVSVSSELEGTDGYLIDMISGKDSNGNFYKHLEIASASRQVVNSLVTNYCLGGTDGDMTFSDLDLYVRDWCSGSNHGEFGNVYQHPMTHFYDPGFTLNTKYSLFNMLDLRDNIKIDVSTQDVSLAPNTVAEDLAAGQALAIQALLHPEASIAGVGCHRVGIYAHTGKLVGSDTYSKYVPFTLHRLIQRRSYAGGTYITGSAGGFPNSQVTIFQKPNWTADDDTVRSLAWTSGINVVMHASRTEFFYPSLRTVYPNDTSLLSDDEISDDIIYAIKIARRKWAEYAGVRKPAQKLFALIKQDIDKEMVSVFGSEGLTVVSNVYQTAEDANLGYSVSVDLNFRGSFPTRQFNFNINVARA